MKLNLKLAWLAALVLGPVGLQAQDQAPVSRTEGILSVTTNPGQTTYLGLPYTQEPEIVAEVSSTSGSDITVVGTPLAAGAYTAHSVQILGGANDGLTFPIASNTNSVITINGTVPAGVRGSLDRVQVIPDWTLDSLLGSPPALTGGTSVGLADQIIVEENGTQVAYFYKLPAPPFDPSEGWRRADGTPGDASATRIPPQRGLIIQRNGSGAAVDLVLNGTVKSGTQKASLTTAGQRLNVVSFPFDGGSTLASSGLQAAVQGGTSVGLADQIQVESGGSVLSYFYKLPAPPFDPSEGWRRADGTPGDQGSVAIEPGKAVRVIKNAGASDSTWNVQEPL